jgi:hypothetical protein
LGDGTNSTSIAEEYDKNPLLIDCQFKGDKTLLRALANAFVKARGEL